MRSRWQGFISPAASLCSIDVTTSSYNTRYDNTVCVLGRLGSQYGSLGLKRAIEPYQPNMYCEILAVRPPDHTNLCPEKGKGDTEAKVFKQTNLIFHPIRTKCQ
jgi:hypothetical protein